MLTLSAFLAMVCPMDGMSKEPLVNATPRGPIFATVLVDSSTQDLNAGRIRKLEDTFWLLRSMQGLVANRCI